MDGDFGGEVALPDREWGVSGVGEGGGGNLAGATGDVLIVVSGGQCAGVGDGEFVEGFDELVGGLAEGDDAGVVDGAEEFLELGKGGKESEVGAVFYPAVSFGGDEVDGVAGDDSGGCCVFYNTCYGNCGFIVFA